MYMFYRKGQAQHRKTSNCHYSIEGEFNPTMPNPKTCNRNKLNTWSKRINENVAKVQ